MITSITNDIKLNNRKYLANNNNNQPQFQGGASEFSNKSTKYLDKFLKSQENLSSTRFIQGTLTNWFPKAVLSRSFIDFSEFTFLEFLESFIPQWFI